MINADIKLITIKLDDDGNWSGVTTKYGKEITAREVSPQDVFTRLLTHDGTN